MLEENRQKFEYCNIPAWHKAGYTGQGIKILIMEEGTHGQQVDNVLWQVAPEAYIENRRRPGARVQGGSFCPDTKKRYGKFYQEVKDEGFHIITHSLGGHGAEEKQVMLDELILGAGMIFTTSAGNTGSDIISRRAAYMAQTISVGSANLFRVSQGDGIENFDLRRNDYSSTGPKIDVYGFSGLYTTYQFEKENPQRGAYVRGTSFANPFFTGLLALWMQWRFKQGMRAPNYKETHAFIDKHGKTVDEWGKLLILPDIEQLEKPKEGDTMKIFIDPGHGGRDPGATALGWFHEKDIVLDLAQRLVKRLENYNCEIRMARDDDSFVDNGVRARMANDWGADLYFSIHVNTHASTSANGYEDFIHTSAPSRTQGIQKKIHPPSAKVWTDKNRANRGMKQANFQVLRETRMPAVLLEHGFISNPDDRALLKGHTHRERLADAMEQGIVDAMGLEKKQPEKPGTCPDCERLMRKNNELAKQLEIKEYKISKAMKALKGE